MQAKSLRKTYMSNTHKGSQKLADYLNEVFASSVYSTLVDQAASVEDMDVIILTFDFTSKVKSVRIYIDYATGELQAASIKDTPTAVWSAQRHYKSTQSLELWMRKQITGELIGKNKKKKREVVAYYG